jgi:MFS family permease
VGAALTALAMLFLARADTLWMFFVGYMALQISDDVGTGPYAALVPDYVPENRRGRASGILSQLQLIAQVVAAGAGFALSAQPRTIFLLIAVINILCAIIVIVTLREDRLDWAQAPMPASENKAMDWPSRLKRGAQNWITPWQSADFRWVWFTRFLNSLGFYIILNYLYYYLLESIRVFRLPGGLVLNDAFQATILLSLSISLAGAISSVWGGNLADRIGRKRVIYISGWLMFLTLIPFALIRDYTTILLLSPIFGLGYGGYLSATWALAADTLPSEEDSAKDMGIWQMSVTAPQVIAGFAVSLLIYAGNQRQPGMGYTVAFLVSALAFLAGSLLVKFVRGSS